MIEISTIKNESTPEYGNNVEAHTTSDRIFLLSHYEATNKEFGFDEDYLAYDINRRCAYAWDKGIKSNIEDDKVNTADGERACDWWLRSPGRVSCNGIVDYYLADMDATSDIIAGSFNGVRPALYISLKS